MARLQVAAPAGDVLKVIPKSETLITKKPSREASFAVRMGQLGSAIESLKSSKSGAISTAGMSFSRLGKKVSMNFPAVSTGDP